jgi:hypothetical protein
MGRRGTFSALVLAFLFVRDRKSQNFSPEPPRDFIQVRDASPNNVEALTQILDYNFDSSGTPQSPRIFTGVDVDNTTGNGSLSPACEISPQTTSNRALISCLLRSDHTAYFCTSGNSDVWRFNFNTGALAKIYDRSPRIAWRVRFSSTIHSPATPFRPFERPLRILNVASAAPIFFFFFSFRGQAAASCSVPHGPTIAELRTFFPSHIFSQYS